MIPRPTRKHKFESDFDDIVITAEFDDISKLPKVMEAVISLQPEPVEPVQAGPQPEPLHPFLDAAGKEFDSLSVLVCQIIDGGTVIMVIDEIVLNPTTNKWKAYVHKKDKSDSGFTLQGTGYKRHPGVFKLDADRIEYTKAYTYCCQWGARTL